MIALLLLFYGGDIEAIDISRSMIYIKLKEHNVLAVTGLGSNRVLG